ncbi:helix-turn-helix domain-containing protein [Actinomadura citrea]|jgi:transcriptional regulator with XRE-family HTH domain|uniref:Transcriptional regulator with XRE-family HTH domain n=1 Tax=Actinomadura citrea TaxID=46158 RepID=A0A7Y9GJY4_9ACTN|nr:helix-turn-helix transcriptional regulator [Actinomadura citrea]NYE17789.1 transcriptional regulator with XRE-family HTH domain [Actinomadura citrea]GGT61517.1 transcriptional regulator [Actinomadura citrea]
MTMHTVGELLRQWRHRRRLSQLDLAIAADVSARHVSLVETGKSNPSAAMVLRLADQLDVPLRDRNRLLLAAGFAPRYAERPLDDDALSAARNAVERVLRAHEPYPALAFDRRWNLVMTNRAVDPFLAEVDPELLRPPVNLLRLGLDPRGLARLVVNLSDVRAVFRSRVRRQLAAAPDPGLAALYEELLEPGPEDAPADADVTIQMIVRIGGRELRLFSTITTFGTPLDITLDEVAIESYYPADAESAAYFEDPGRGLTGSGRA